MPARKRNWIVQTRRPVTWRAAFKPRLASNPRLQRALFAARKRPSMINDLWYKNAVIYCLSIATYLDTDGDGIGDFRGLMSRLDYLQGTGCDRHLADALSALSRQGRRL